MTITTEYNDIISVMEFRIGDGKNKKADSQTVVPRTIVLK